MPKLKTCLWITAVVAIAYIVIGFFLLAICAISELPGNTGSTAPSETIKAVFDYPFPAPSPNPSLVKELLRLLANGIVIGAILCASAWILRHWLFPREPAGQQKRKNTP